MASLLTILAMAITALTLSAPRPADAEEGGARRHGQDPLTSVEAVLREGVQLVVVGTLQRVDTSRSQQIAQVEVSQSLQGPKVDKTITVLVPGPGPRLDRQAPSGAWIRPGDTRRYIFLLRQGRGGHAWTYHRKVEAEGPIGDEKILVFQEELRLAALEDDEARARATVAWLLKQLQAQGMWTRIHAARELGRAAAARRDLFDDRAHGRIKSALRRRISRDQRTWLQNLDRYLESTPRPARAPRTTPERASGLTPVETSWRELYKEGDIEARRKLLRGLRGARLGRHVERLYWAWRVSEDDTRHLVLSLLVEAAPEGLAKWLRLRYAHHEAVGIREALVRHLGFVGTQDDVAWLVARAGNPHLQRTAWLALARIRTPAAVAHLQAARDRLALSKDPDAAFGRAWLDHLLSPAFEKARSGDG